MTNGLRGANPTLRPGVGLHTSTHATRVTARNDVGPGHQQPVEAIAEAAARKGQHEVDEDDAAEPGHELAERPGQRRREDPEHAERRRRPGTAGTASTSARRVADGRSRPSPPPTAGRRGSTRRPSQRDHDGPSPYGHSSGPNCCERGQPDADRAEDGRPLDPAAHLTAPAGGSGSRRPTATGRGARAAPRPPSRRSRRPRVDAHEQRR